MMTRSNGKTRLVRSAALLAACLLLGVLMAIQFKSVNSAQNQQLLQNKRLEELQAEVIARQKTNRELSDMYNKLKDAVAALENQMATNDDTLQRVLEEKRFAETFAGLTEVSGTGILVTVEGLAGGETLVRDVDLQMVVNELRAAGAQAIAINDERMVAMSEIRQGGVYIVINGRPFPVDGSFTIKAIALKQDLERALTMISGVADSLRFYNLNVVITKADRVVIPRLREDSPAYRTDFWSESP